ncbi:unnamed protein product, partial [Polarella glacialis]
ANIRGSAATSLGQEARTEQLFEVFKYNGANCTLRCPTVYALDGLLHSNLGSQGPDEGAESLIYNVSHYEDGHFVRKLILEVKALSRYRGGIARKNGRKGEIGIISLASDLPLAEFQFSFKDSFGMPLTVSDCPVTFFNIDSRSPDVEQDYVIGHGNFSQVAREPVRQMPRAIFDDSSSASAASLSWRPNLPSRLSSLMSDWTMVLRYQDVQHFMVTVGSTGKTFSKF